MTNTSDNPMDALNSLMEERARYESWLAQLDARRASTPPHVFDRVRADYDGRLRNVIDQLAGRASELEGTASSLADRVARLFSEETAQRDERAEAELRAAVGEFAEPQAREVIDRCDVQIDSLSSQRAEVGGELAKVQEILSLVARTTPPNVVTQREPARGGVPARPVADATGKGGASPGFDELAFLQSVVDDRPASPSTPPAPSERSTRASAPRAEPAPRANGRADALQSFDEEFLTPPALSSARRQTPPPPPPPSTSPSLSPRDNPAEGEHDPKLTPGTLPAFLKEMPTEQIKTLKCQECGTMNYPTEWYCERCGGELAAM